MFRPGLILLLCLLAACDETPKRMLLQPSLVDSGLANLPEVGALFDSGFIDAPQYPDARVDQDSGRRGVDANDVDAGLGYPREVTLGEPGRPAIMHIPKDIKEGKPGYKLMVNGSDISNNLQKVNSEIARVFNKPLKISHYIQGPRFCSQLVSHIHGFVYEREEETFGKVFRQSYINLDHIISLRYQASKTPPRRASRSPRSPPRLNLKKKSWCCATC